MNDNAPRIKHTFHCIGHIQEWTAPGRRAFVDSTMIQSAIVHELEVIGEATKAHTKEFRDAHPKVPWKG